jgi:hypothetical protein
VANTDTNPGAGAAGAVQVTLGKDLPASNSQQTFSTQVLHAELIGDDTCTGGGTIVRGRAPALALCRQLLAAGCNPDAALTVFRNGIVSLRIRTLAEGASLTVEECSDGRPRFRPYRPHSSEERPPMRQTDVALTEDWVDWPPTDGGAA